MKWRATNADRTPRDGPSVTAGLPDPAEIAQVFAAASGAGAILLAVSGGPDSMAMLRLAELWQRGGQAPPLSVATVDHGLRVEAAAEAGLVAQWSAALGLPHSTRVWPGPHPRTRLQEAARAARYRLLTDHAGAQGANVIMLAHHGDDQAETVLFRLARGSGIDGLAGMAVLTARGPLTLFRPFLAWPKTRLVAVCVALGQPFIDDPSNSNPRFVRTGLRRFAGVFATAGLDAPALGRLALRAARMRDAVDARVQDIMTQLAPLGVAGGLTVDFAVLAGHPEEIVLRVLGALVTQVSGSPKPLRLDRLECLCADLLAAQAQCLPFKATLAGTCMSLHADARLTVMPEAARRRGRKQVGEA